MIELELDVRRLVLVQSSAYWNYGLARGPVSNEKMSVEDVCPCRRLIGKIHVS